MNMLAVTLWYLKHYHSERYIASELNLSQSAVNYVLSILVDILHTCAYQELVSIPANLSHSRTPHGPQQYHKVIVDSTCIAIPEPYDSEQRKAYYHMKSSTNNGLKAQITCDFRHRIVHVCECVRGSVHDITLVRDSGLLDPVNDDVYWLMKTRILIVTSIAQERLLKISINVLKLIQFLVVPIEEVLMIFIRQQNLYKSFVLCVI